MDDYMALQALSAFNSSLQNAANIYMAAGLDKEDRNFSREMSDLAYQRNIELWNMQNEYNLPVNQYARQLEGLRANGLNPNLVYGGSSSIGGAAGSVSPFKFEGYHSTAVPRFSGADSVQSLLSTRLLQTQVAAQEANNRLINARADNEEARLPGVSAKSEESAARWRYKLDHPEAFAEALQGSLAVEYWRGAKSEEEAKILHEKYRMSYFDAEIADWLNTAQIEGLGMTYRQYMEYCKTLIPAAQYAKFRADVFDIASRIAYRTKQGELLDLKKEYQTYINRLAKYGRSLGNDWVTLLLSGLYEVFGIDPGEEIKTLLSEVGNTQTNISPTYPGP